MKAIKDPRKRKIQEYDLDLADDLNRLLATKDPLDLFSNQYILLKMRIKSMRDMHNLYDKNHPISEFFTHGCWIELLHKNESLFKFTIADIYAIIQNFYRCKDYEEMYRLIKKYIPSADTNNGKSNYVLFYLIAMVWTKSEYLQNMKIPKIIIETAADIDPFIFVYRKVIYSEKSKLAWIKNEFYEPYEDEIEINLLDMWRHYKK